MTDTYNELKPVFIYLLSDPDTLEPRYVGKSIRPAQRLQNHMNERSNCHRSHWLQSLKRQGKMPILSIIEEIRGEWPWQESERFWISRLRSQGANLVNNTAGGDGVCGLPPETRAKMRLTWLGRKHKPESLLKLSAVRKGKRHSPETREKRSISLKAVPHTEEWNTKVSAAIRKLTAEQVETIKTRLAAGELNVHLSREYGVHRTTLSKITMGRYFDRYRTSDARRNPVTEVKARAESS